MENNKVQMDHLEKRVNERLSAIDERLQADSQPLRRNQAAVGAKLDQIELDLGRLQGQIEEAAAVSARQGERIGELQQGQMTSLLELQKTVSDLELRLNRVASYLGIQELTAAAATQAEEKVERPEGGQATVAEAAVPETTVQQTIPPPEELYQEALQLFRSGQFSESRALFARYLEQYANTDLADNSQFWLGESYYAENNYREAIAAYEKTIKDYPKSDKVSSALLKQGMAFLELGDKTAAKILLKKVVKNYPETNQARIAQRKLAGIK
jgi:tol-pal system protein YbgF